MTAESIRNSEERGQDLPLPILLIQTAWLTATGCRKTLPSWRWGRLVQLQSLLSPREHHSGQKQCSDEPPTMNVASMVCESQAGKAILWMEIRHDAFSNLGYPLHSTISGYLPSNHRGKIERGKKINLLDILNIYTESPSKGLSMAMLLHYWNMFPSFLGEFIPSQLHAPLLPLSSPQGLGWFDHLRFASCSEVTCRSYELPSIPMDSCSANETNLS